MAGECRRAERFLALWKLVVVISEEVFKEGAVLILVSTAAIPFFYCMINPGLVSCNL